MSTDSTQQNGKAPDPSVDARQEETSVANEPEDDVEFNDDNDSNDDESWSDSERKKRSTRRKNQKVLTEKKTNNISTTETTTKKKKPRPSLPPLINPNKNRKTSTKMSTSSASAAAATASINPEYLADIKQTFENFDQENKGRFDIKQLKFAMRALGFEPKKEEIKKITFEYDKDGYILYDDFLELMIKRITEKTVNDEIMKAFQLFDTNQHGKITFDDLKRVATELGEKITDEELEEMIEEADLDGDKAVDCQEFLRIMKKTFLY